MEQNLIDFFSNDHYAALTGAEILEAGEGHCRCRLKISEKHLNAVGTVQGGAIFTLADFAFAIAANSRGQVAMAVNVNISFLKAVNSGELFATASEVAEPSRLGCYEVKVTTGDGELVAQFNGMVYRKREPLPF